MTARVYFVEGAGLIKIGTSTDLSARLDTLQSCSPCRLTLLASFPGGTTEERRLHALFAASRAHGEWFAITPQLSEVISRVAAADDDDARLRVFAETVTATATSLSDEDIARYRTNAARVHDAFVGFVRERGIRRCAAELGVVERYLVGCLRGENHLRAAWVAQFAPLSAEIRSALLLMLPTRSEATP